MLCGRQTLCNIPAGLEPRLHDLDGMSSGLGLRTLVTGEDWMKSGSRSILHIDWSVASAQEMLGSPSLLLL